MTIESICFFTHYGRTYTFRECAIVTDNETVIVVEYKAMSDGKTKRVTMQKTNIVGWAVTP